MTREEAVAIPELPREEAIQAILALAQEAKKHAKLVRADMATPSGPRPTSAKETTRNKHKKKPGRNKGHLSPGGLTQAWIRLAELLRPEYGTTQERIRHSAALHADETGRRLAGGHSWLWAFCTNVDSPSLSRQSSENWMGL